MRRRLEDRRQLVVTHFLAGLHDDDERQSMADRSTYHSPLQSLFEPVPMPRWLKPRKSKKLL